MTFNQCLYIDGPYINNLYVRVGSNSENECIYSFKITFFITKRHLTVKKYMVIINNITSEFCLPLYVGALIPAVLGALSHFNKSFTFLKCFHLLSFDFSTTLYKKGLA